MRSVCKEDIRKLFPPRRSRINKGDCGRVLCVCGSYDGRGRGMCGAAYFAAASAYRMGAGIVEIFTPSENYMPLAVKIPEAVFSLYGYGEEIPEVTSRLSESLRSADAVVIGCGLGKSEMSRALVRATMSLADCPLVIDADALNIISEDSSMWSLMPKKQRERTIITPHPGEMSRLCGIGIDKILDGTAAVAQDFAAKKGVVCLLKDNKTVISDGKTVYINQSGNSGMATAGMGDVLAGIVGGCLAGIGLCGVTDILFIAAASAYIHGLSGDAAAEKYGRYSLMSSDVIEQIPSIISDVIMENT